MKAWPERPEKGFRKQVARFAACVLTLGLLTPGALARANEEAALGGSASSLIRITACTDGGNFTSGKLYATASLTARVVDPGGHPVTGATVTWSVLSARNRSPAMMPGWESKKTGLTWGDAPESGNGGHACVYERLQEERIVSATDNTTTTAADGETTMRLTDIVGERIITVQAKVTIDGTDHRARRAVSFGDGPLSVFLAPVGIYYPHLTWEEAYNACNGVNAYTTHAVTPGAWRGLSKATYPANYAGGSAPGTDDGGMPTRAEYQAVSAADARQGVANPNPGAQGAAFAAGWPDDGYWAGEVYRDGYAFGVNLNGGKDHYSAGHNRTPIACRRSITNSRGTFPVTLAAVFSPADGTASATGRGEDDERAFALPGNVAPLNGLAVEFSGGGAFTTPGEQGYQSVLAMRVKKVVDGVEDTTWRPDGNVAWTVSSVVSGLSGGMEGVWKRAVDAKNGLMWLASAADSVDGATDWSADAILGAAPAGVTAWLADVVGSRTITVTVADGSDRSGGRTFTFGPGPLSAFRKIGRGGMQWSRGNGFLDNTRVDPQSFQHPANAFPAASFCGGEVNNDVTATHYDPCLDPHCYEEEESTPEDLAVPAGGACASDAGFDPDSGGWGPLDYLPAPDVDAAYSADYAVSYATSSKMATAKQLLAVAAYSAYNNNSGEAAGRKGAALAAGWPVRTWLTSFFLTGEVHYFSGFTTIGVDLGDGRVFWHDVSLDEGIPACVP